MINAPDNVRVAAVQLETRIADRRANIEACRKLAEAAVKEGAGWVALPEFFTTGVAWEPRIVDAIETEEGAARAFLQDFSERHGVVIGGSFLCRISSGAVRNRYLAFGNGRLIGRHDKDLPTMWENAFYEGGDPFDTGVLGSHDGVRVGAAVCWEFMRTRTARRLRNRVDVILGGSCWWSVPDLVPVVLRTRWERHNLLNVTSCIQDTARLAGAPVIHAAHCGDVMCPFFGLPPFTYRGCYEGGAAVVDATGRVIARRDRDDGEGIVSADIPLRSVEVQDSVPDRFWLRPRGILPAIAWHYHGWLGRLWYRRHVRGARA